MGFKFECGHAVAGEGFVCEMSVKGIGRDLLTRGQRVTAK